MSSVERPDSYERHLDYGWSLGMRDFWHFAGMAARRRWTLAGILFTSIVVAALWGTNIGALYPIVKVVFAGKGDRSTSQKNSIRCKPKRRQPQRNSHGSKPSSAKPALPMNVKRSGEGLKLQRRNSKPIASVHKSCSGSNRTHKSTYPRLHFRPWSWSLSSY